MPTDLRVLPSLHAPPKIVVVPVGSIEQHCNMPVGTDCLIAEKLAWKACERAESRAGFTCVIAPPLCYGFRPDWKALPGTISLPLDVFTGMVRAIVADLWSWGVERIVFLNAHGGNSPALRAVLAEASSLARDKKLVALIDYWKTAGLDLGHGSKLEANIARGLGIHVEYSGKECDEAEVAGEGLYVYTSSRTGLKSLKGSAGKIEVSEVIEKVADAIIKVFRADISKHWIG